VSRPLPPPALRRVVSVPLTLAALPLLVATLPVWILTGLVTSLFLPGRWRGLRLLWFGTGKEDFLLSTTNATVDLFKRHGFSPVFVESPGGHTWINWRNYLSEFAPQLFRSKG